MPPFEIFLKEPDGGVLWRGSAESLEDAKARVTELARKTPGDYLVWNYKTGDGLTMTIDGKPGEQGRSGSVRRGRDARGSEREGRGS